MALPSTLRCRAIRGKSTGSTVVRVHTRRQQQQQQPSEPEERGDEMEWTEEAGVPQQQAEAEEGEVDYDPGPPSPPLSRC